jgi:hypothetical protein
VRACVYCDETKRSHTRTIIRLTHYTRDDRDEQQDYCPTAESGYHLDEWLESMAPLPDGSLPRMDLLLHTSPTTTPSKCADVRGESPLGEVQQWCGVDRSMFQWLAQPEVIKALHVDKPKGTEQNNLRCD